MRARVASPFFIVSLREARASAGAERRPSSSQRRGRTTAEEIVERRPPSQVRPRTLDEDRREAPELRIGLLAGGEPAQLARVPGRLQEIVEQAAARADLIVRRAVARAVEEAARQLRLEDERARE